MKKAMFVVLLAAVALALMATSAFAATTGFVDIQAKVNSAVALKIDTAIDPVSLTPLLKFGPIDPGQTDDKTADISVQSNCKYKLQHTGDLATFAANGFSFTGVTPFDNLTVYNSTGGAWTAYQDTIRFSATWAMDPASTYSSHVDYDVVVSP